MNIFRVTRRVGDTKFVYASSKYVYKQAKHKYINVPIRLGTSQYSHFFYTRSHLSALQNCAIILSTTFQFIFTIKKCMNVHTSIFMTKKQIKTRINNTLNQVSHLSHNWMLYFPWQNSIEGEKICYMCKQESSSDKYTKTYTRKELVLMDTTIYYFYTRFYIPSIQELDFHLLNVRILGTNHCS